MVQVVGLSSLNRLKQMAIFCKVIECGSMRAAAQELGMTPSAVSQHLSQLEKEIDVPLVYRSTRKISLSEAGKRYYQHGKKMLMAAEDAEDAINEVKHSLEGELRISAPVGLASRPLAKAFKNILNSNKGLRLTILAQDKSIDLVSEQIDIAIRIGEPEESSFIYHPLGILQKGIYASPSYLSNHSNPVIPKDLCEHLWLGFLRNDDFSEVSITHASNESFQYVPECRMRFNDLNVLAGHVQEGFGMAILPEQEVRHLVESGSLIRVLPEWKSKEHKIYALTIDRKHSYKINAAMKELKDYFKE